jgi:membrane protease subunit (stomatin/prohibitin family)
VLLRDPDFGPVRVRAFGVYTLRALDPRRLLEQLVGTDGVFEADEIGELLRSIIGTAFADLVAKSEIALLDLSKNYQSLSDQLRHLVRARIDDEYGLEIPQLFIVNVSVPAEVEQALDARSSMNVIGDMAAYQAYQLGQSMPVAAANPAGGLAGAGVGVGMGMAIASPLLGGAARGTPPAAPPPVPAAGYWIVEQGRPQGPLPPAQLAAAGRLRPDTLVWTAGMTDWQPAGQVAALAAWLPPPSAQTNG